MNPLEQYRQYVDRLTSRFRLRAIFAGAAFVALCALAATIAVSAWMNGQGFSETSLLWGRVLLFSSLALAIGLGLAAPIARITRRRAVNDVERRFPEFEQRLLTLEQTPESEHSPFLELIARDVGRIADRARPSMVVENRSLYGWLSAAAAGAGILVWLILAGPGYLGYGAARLWAGPPRQGDTPLYQIIIAPGDRKVRKGSDQVVEAQLMGFESNRVDLFVRRETGAQWESVPMVRKEAGTGYQFLFAGMTENLEYYAQSGPVKSTVHRLTVVSLPAVQRIKTTLRFPRWAGMADVTEDPGGDLRGVDGTQASLEITTDRPLSKGFLVLGDGTQIPLEGDGATAINRAALTIQKDGFYYVAALDGNDRVRISEDYFIEARKEEPPTIRVTRPGRDVKISPIEEVTVEVTARDDYGLQQVELHYQVNGGEEKTLNMLRRKGAGEAQGSTLIELENYKLIPGDILSIWAVARDARNTVRSDIFFFEAQPFEFEITQSQTMGGQGAPQQEENISARQKEIIAATWNEVRGSKTKALQEENSRFLSGVQTKLADQARSLARRMKSRELAGQNQQFQAFSQNMETAAQAMAEAVDQLKTMRWREALAPEQRALQHLLRAEALFREIQMAFGGSSGGVGSSGRDLASLFDLELDTEKNQYEAGSQPQSQQKAQAVDESLKRLEELARRQQELAKQQQQQKQQNFQQRWAQEMLRREAEELRRQMEELAKGGQPQSGQQQQQNSQQQGQSGQSSSSSNAGQQGNQNPRARLQGMAGDRNVDPRLERALEELRRATEDMRKSAQQNLPGQPKQGDPAGAQRAADRLNEAMDQLGTMRRQETGDQMSSIADRAQRLADQQKDFEQRMRQTFGSAQGQGRPQAGAGNREQNERLANEKAAMQREFEKLEQDMQKAAREMANSQRAAASKLRDALGDAQQSELKSRMKFGADWIRRGMGQYMVPREGLVTQDLQRLQEQVQQAQQAMGKSPSGREGLNRSLDQLERLRNQMQQLAQGNQSGQPGQQGQQQGQQSQPGQNGQQGQEGQQSGQQGRPGNQQGQQAQGAQGGRSGQPGLRQQGGQAEGLWRDGYSAMNRGDLMPPQGSAPQPGRMDPKALEQFYAEAMRQLQQLRAHGAEDPEIASETGQLIREMQRLDPKRFPGNPLLLERLRTGILPSLEQLELRLRRKLDDQSGGQVRSASSEKPPVGYADAVAEYFRRLSRSK